MTTDKKSVTVWTQGPREYQWCKEIYQDLGHVDFARVYLGFLVGSGPDKKDMVVDNYVESRLDDRGPEMISTHIYPKTGMPPEITGGEEPVLLGVQLSGQAQQLGKLYIDTRPRNGGKNI